VHLIAAPSPVTTLSSEHRSIIQSGASVVKRLNRRSPVVPNAGTSRQLLNIFDTAACAGPK
jgi:hypothetical protein